MALVTEVWEDIVIMAVVGVCLFFREAAKARQRGLRCFHCRCSTRNIACESMG